MAENTRMRERLKVMKAGIDVKNMEQDKLNRTFDKISILAKRKGWNTKVDMYRDICPVCDNLIKYDKDPVMPGVHSSCIIDVSRTLS